MTAILPIVIFIVMVALNIFSSVSIDILLD